MTTRSLRCWIPLATLAGCCLSPLRAAPAVEPDISAAPWRTGFIYDVYSPLYGRSLPEAKRDTNFDGKPLTVDGKRYERGFGARGFSIIELDVPPGVTGLSATIGVDDWGAGAGNGTYFAIWGDGKQLWRSPALCRSDPAVALTIPLSGVRALKLITDAQGYGNADLADWCEPRWLTDGPPGKPLWKYLTPDQPWQVRAELHPFNLAYRGEPLMVTVLGPVAASAELSASITDEAGGSALKDRLSVTLKPTAQAAAAAIVALDLGRVPNGIDDLKLSATSGGRTMAERTIRFGLIASRLGRPSEGTIFGVNHHEFMASYEPLAAIGCEYSRQWFCWAWIEPRRGEWHWNWHDERVAEAERFGLKTIGVLGGIGEPAWTSPDHVAAGETTTHGCPADMADWEDYVRAVATRYKGRVTVWESWNEIMGLAQSGLDGWSVAKYVDLHRRTYTVLKEVDPRNRLLLSADRLSFVQQCLDAGVGGAFDGIVPHPYRPGSTPEAWVVNYTVDELGDVASAFTSARKWLDGHGLSRAGVWATEIGWAVSGKDWAIIPVRTHGEYVPRTYQLAQASGQAANLSWHDFAHFMFGLADPSAVPRPALLTYAAMVPRLTGATAIRRLGPGPRVRGVLFRRGGAEMLTLCAEHETAFALLKPPAATRVRAFDWYGNETALELPARGRALALDGRIVYLEAPSLRGVEVSEIEPLSLTPAAVEAVPGGRVELVCSIENAFGQTAEFVARPDPTEGLTFPAADPLRLAPGERGEVRLVGTIAREAAAGRREVSIAVAVPGDVKPVLRSTLTILPPVIVRVVPFDCARLGPTPTPVRVELCAAEGKPLAGEVTFTVPEGLHVTPGVVPFADLTSQPKALEVALTADRAIASSDTLAMRVRCADGAHHERTLSLAPTVLDADGDGVADGWQLNPEGGPPDRRNLAQATIAPGDSEFFCQKITCTRFGGGWIILHRDGQDKIVAGRRYRAIFRARTEGLKGAVGVAVYNIQPWQSCGLEVGSRIGADWQAISIPFTATRDSNNVRFELFFTEVGTVWLEGMRLEEVR